MKTTGWGALILLVCLLANSGGLVGAEVLLIQGYRHTGSPIKSYLSNCQFRPTCSRYALQSLEEAGFWKGNLRIMARFVDCSPIGLLGRWLGGYQLSSGAGPAAN